LVCANPSRSKESTARRFNSSDDIHKGLTGIVAGSRSLSPVIGPPLIERSSNGCSAFAEEFDELVEAGARFWAEAFSPGAGSFVSGFIFLEGGATYCLVD
jgi:hypothetical protein